MTYQEMRGAMWLDVSSQCEDRIVSGHAQQSTMAIVFAQPSPAAVSGCLTRARDEFLHDFICSAVNSVHARIRKLSSYGRFPHESHAAVKLTLLRGN
mmetsp:Transcript_23543/g.66184  ORF Transcript_23543/g.66184 Transcript_23543/m.66184 type:complete len:97 (+) Transcript_23543:192-482(+)